MIAEADAKWHSGAAAAFALRLAGVEISSRHVQRMALGIGVEMAKQRDHKALQRAAANCLSEWPARRRWSPSRSMAGVFGPGKWLVARGCISSRTRRTR
jgi:hypothetical protein